MDWPAIFLSLKLSSLACGFLLLIGTPLAYWVTYSRWRWKFLVESVVALPIVLPPTVLGFYILVAIGSRSPIGRAWAAWSGHGLAFTFEGLVIASVVYRDRKSTRLNSSHSQSSYSDFCLKKERKCSQ